MRNQPLVWLLRALIPLPVLQRAARAHSWELFNTRKMTEPMTMPVRLGMQGSRSLPLCHRGLTGCVALQGATWDADEQNIFGHHFRGYGYMVMPLGCARDCVFLLQQRVVLHDACRASTTCCCLICAPGGTRKCLCIRSRHSRTSKRSAGEPQHVASGGRQGRQQRRLHNAAQSSVRVPTCAQRTQTELQPFDFKENESTLLTHS